MSHECEQCENWKQQLLDAARDLNPNGATLLDFYVVWLEQERAKNVRLAQELATARAWLATALHRGSCNLLTRAPFGKDAYAQWRAKGCTCGLDAARGAT